ncbi:hypothetical protein GXW82_02310 [Streptacidiphilus sp. 4-A2]|nr:hypothetical protein [Streptacidiphilus sp. 4-A2]
MRWLILYTRSRQVPASAVAVLAVALAAWVCNQGGGQGATDLGTTALVLTAMVAAGSVGLDGRDAVLERTAAIRWMPRRAAHVLLIGAVTGAALLAAQAMGAELAPVEVVVRDGVGLAGLAALGAVLCGAPFAWTLPTGWLAFTVLVPPMSGTAGEVASWMIFPADTAPSTGTALALLVTGTAWYGAAGPRR